ncbi:MAG: isoprenylcysteine carboxylmethyltransferase family protein [Candidatus Thorarchaeota archaeon]|nr:isoprenylcysteine carboxylmethyltransferase family protein [Candidatus Thorarchaeota archaeon]
MFDIFVVGPIIAILAGINIILHVYLDSKKSKEQGKSVFREPSVAVPSSALVIASLTTLLAFVLVGTFPLAWIASIITSETTYLFYIVELPTGLWISGLVVLCLGILLHGWARYVRQEMASSWAMSEEHRLITKGPYSRVRHPSYTSYFICFIGLFFLLPSLISVFLFVGFWGYNRIAVAEEENLLQHFGGAYSEYVKRTGRFLPGL